MNPRQRNVVIAVVGVIVALGIAAALLAGGGDGGGSKVTSDGKTIEEYRPVDVTGAALPKFQQSANDAAAGKAAPELRGHAFDGSDVTITNSGRPKAIMFVAHWCPHCQNEVPVVRDFLDAGKGEGVDFYAVSTNASSQAPNWPPSEWLANEKWPTPVLADDQQSSAANAYGLASFPYFVFVGKDGNIVLRTSGELPVEQLSQAVSLLRK